MCIQQNIFSEPLRLALQSAFPLSYKFFDASAAQGQILDNVRVRRCNGKRDQAAIAKVPAAPATYQNCFD